METKSINIDESFEVILKGKGAAGYEWQYKVSPKDIVSVEQNKQSAKNSSPPMPGRSSDETFTITALKKGTAVLHFYLVRTWEAGTVEPKNEKKIEVNVE